MEDLLAIKNLNIQARTRAGVLNVVKDLSFSIKKGETLGVVGESGCGKSVTALSVMNLLPEGILSISSGDIIFNDVAITELPENKLENIRGNEISMIFQEPMASFAPAITIGNQMVEQLLIHTSMSKRQATKVSVEMLEKVGINEPEKRFFQYSFPEGVALRLDPFYGFDMNSHYVNYTDQTTYGEVYTNLHTINPSEVSHVAEILQLNNTEFSLAPMETTVVNVDYWIGDEFEGYDDLNVFQLQSHAHQKNLEFRIYKISESDPDYREMIYMALDWEHPPIINYDPPIVFNSDEGFELEATYYNNTEDTTKFGFLSTDEMMILFGLFYPNSELSSDKQISIPLQFNLNQNFPNPFNPFTTISYNLPRQTSVDLSIFDLSGRKLVTLVNRKQAPGKKSFTWNGLNDQGGEVGSGVYIYRVTTNQTTQSKKMLLIK